MRLIFIPNIVKSKPVNLFVYKKIRFPIFFPVWEFVLNKLMNSIFHLYVESKCYHVWCEFDQYRFSYVGAKAGDAQGGNIRFIYRNIFTIENSTSILFGKLYIFTIYSKM